MGDETGFKPEMENNTKHDSISSSQLVDFAIQDATNNKKTLDSAMDSVMRFMKQVECEEKAAQQAKEDADKTALDILAKFDQLKQAQHLAKETNAMHSRELCAQTTVLATELEELQLRVSNMLDDQDKFLAVLDEMCRALTTRMISALFKKALADEEKLVYKRSTKVALAYEESEMRKVVEESKRLKQEATENSKLQQFLMDRGHVVDMLYGEISEKWRDVKLLSMEMEMEMVIPQIGSLFPTQTSSLTTSHDSIVLPRNSSLNSENHERNEDWVTRPIQIECRKCMNAINRRSAVREQKGRLNEFPRRNRKKGRKRMDR